MQSVKECNNNWNNNSKLRFSSWCSQNWKKRRRNPFLVVWLCVTECSIYVPPKIFSWTLAYLPHSVNGGALNRKFKALVCVLRPALVLSGVLKRLWASVSFLNWEGSVWWCLCTYWPWWATILQASEWLIDFGPFPSSVSQMPVAEGKSVQQTVELLTRKLEMLGAEKQGTFCVDCETYHTAASTLGSQGQWEMGLWDGWNLVWS